MEQAYTLTPQPDLSSWLSKAEAAKLLGVSERTLERIIKVKDSLEVRMRRRTGLKSQPVINPEDVQHLLATRRVTVVTPRDKGPLLDSRTVLEIRLATDSLWLTLKGAAEYSGLSMALLQRLASRGQVEALKDDGWKIRRSALENLSCNRIYPA